MEWQRTVGESLYRMTTCTLNPIVILCVGVLLLVNMIKISFYPINDNYSNNKNDNNDNNNSDNSNNDYR